MKKTLIILLFFPTSLIAQISPAIYELLLNGDGPIKVLAMGQSNASGRAFGGDFKVNNNVKVWNNSNGFSDLSYIGDRWILPNRNLPPFRSGRNNMMFHAVNHISRITGREVQLTLITKGGISIDNWATKQSPMYVRAKSILGESKSSKIDVFLWHQGEADSYGGHNSYKSKFDGMVANLKSDGILSGDVKTVFGEISINCPQQINNVYSTMVTPTQKLARIKNLPTFDGVHFSAASLIAAGEEYAKEYFKMTDMDYYAPLVGSNTPPTTVAYSGYNSSAFLCL